MFKKLFSTPRIPIKYHLLFWSVYFLLNVIRFGIKNQDYWYSLKSNLVEFPLNILITYFTIYFLIPKFIVKKKYLLFFLYFVPLLIVFYLVRTGLNYTLVTTNIWPEAEGFQKAFSLSHFLEVTLFGIVYVIGLVSAIKLTYDWINEKRKNEQLAKIQLQTELNFLKMQIQPHFFFNTLNNLYALVIKKSPNAPDVVLKLSEIMQYVLYEVKEPKIDLLKEINYIQSYLELEELRYGDKAQFEIEITGNIDEVKIPPLLFLPFIENCFKHGTINTDHIKVLISFEMKDNFLYFTVKNNFNPESLGATKHGIGIKNVKRRLQLIYSNNYELNIKIADTVYTVVIKIPVDEN